MKNLFKLAIVAIAMVIAMPQMSAQLQRDIAKERKEVAKLAKSELTAKASKDARKEAKKLKKDGWVVTPGTLPMEKQLDRCYMMQFQYDEEMNPKYIMAEAMSIGENYDAAKRQAIQLAVENIAQQISSQITMIAENTVANSQLAKEEAASITETVTASKNLISKELGRVLPVMECYRVKANKNKEVLVRLAYDQNQAMAKAKEVVKKQLEDKGVKLHNQLDKALGF